MSKEEKGEKWKQMAEEVREKKKEKMSKEKEQETNVVSIKGSAQKEEGKVRTRNCHESVHIPHTHL